MGRSDTGAQAVVCRRRAPPHSTNVTVIGGELAIPNPHPNQAPAQHVPCEGHSLRGRGVWVRIGGSGPSSAASQQQQRCSSRDPRSYARPLRCRRDGKVASPAKAIPADPFPLTLF